MVALADSSAAFDPRQLGGHFERDAEGIWHATEREPVSYLEEGNAQCFELEEQSFWFAHRAACLQAVVRRFPPAGTIYDIGGGNGFVTRRLIDAGFDTVLIEPGEAGARNAARRGIPKVVCATLATAQFRAASLPAAGIFDVLEHIEDDGAFLGELHHALAPQGRLYVTVPAHSWLWSDDDVVAGHFRRHTIGGMTRRLHAAGFKLLYATYFFSLLPVALFALRSIPSLFGRRSLPRKSYGRLHQPRARSFTDRIWANELRRIENGGGISIGSSCLLVAEKEPTS
ncbi:MAG: methyltransferase domain-containing protein [Chthoniobacteraceae bacterium]